MANEEQLSILKQGVEVWNKWRSKNWGVFIDLSEASLSRANLRGANLAEVILSKSNLEECNLRESFVDRSDLRQANLRGADLTETSLERAYLNEANLIKSELWAARLSGANLSEANLAAANLSHADLTKANLGGADLRLANLDGAHLRESIFRKAKVGKTIFGNSDLSEVIGLDDSVHSNPSIMSVGALAASKGKIPKIFLRGCGVSDWEIEMVKLYNPDLSNEERNKALYKIYDLQGSQAIQVSPLFISYGHTDATFVDKLESHLNKIGVRFWRDIHDMKAGRIETQIDRAISQNRTVLLVLSEHSIKSDWVEHEVRTARRLEKDMGRDVLCPIALDDSWKSSPWTKRVMEQIMEYNILDFSAWEDDVKFEGMFRKLIDGLELFYKDKSHGE